MHRTLGLIDNPEGLLKGKKDLVRFEYLHDQSYLYKPPLELTIICQNQSNGLHGFIMPHDQVPDEMIGETLEGIAAQLHAPIVNFTSPLPLSPIGIPKPWGEEIWYTAMEKRGVCTMANIPIPWILDTFPKTLSGQSYAPPILLKVLKPLADPVKGDLYFEAHAEKKEVYVVTEVDQEAWPDGKGKIRFGFDRVKRDHYESTKAFAAAYLKAVQDYWQVRSALDRGERIDNETEESLRREMESFTSLRDLEPGDVVQVPPLTPHSLQHGVTVVEFQTPHYERYILSFGQKVLTQDHWDTEDALSSVSFATDTPLTGNLDDIIADFDEFSVQRLHLQPGESLDLPGQSYAIVMCITGELRITDTCIPESAAYFLPAESNKTIQSDTNSILLLAVPN